MRTPTTLTSLQKAVNLLSSIEHTDSSFLAHHAASLVELVPEPSERAGVLDAEALCFSINMVYNTIDVSINHTPLLLSCMSSNLALAVGEDRPLVAHIASLKREWRRVETNFHDDIICHTIVLHISRSQAQLGDRTCATHGCRQCIGVFIFLVIYFIHIFAHLFGGFRI